MFKAKHKLLVRNLLQTASLPRRKEKSNATTESLATLFVHAIRHEVKIRCATKDVKNVKYRKRSASDRQLSSALWYVSELNSMPFSLRLSLFCLSVHQQTIL
jgi:hypothetical protein